MLENEPNEYNPVKKNQPEDAENEEESYVQPSYFPVF